MRNKTAYIRLRKEKTWKTKLLIFTLVILAIIFYGLALWRQEWNISGSRISPFTILFRLFIAPFISLEYLSDLPLRISQMFETIAIAYAGGVAASILALPIAFLSARNISGRFSFIGKTILNAIRAIPEIVFGILFVAALGIGPYPGVLAISINSIGMLGKLYAETIESIDEKKVEAIRAAGGNQIQVFWYAILPQVLPEFASFSLYRFEIDVRSSTILGLVGAGGIGVPLMLAQQQRNWENVGLILVIIILFVGLIDVISAKIRNKIIG
jgi:phosphonate transport system permease protein